jgi:hypothetical protein
MITWRSSVVLPADLPLARPRILNRIQVLWSGDIVKTKTLWKDIEKPLRRPNSTWKLTNAARWFEKLLGIPAGTVVFIRPDGERTKPNQTVASLRAKRETRPVT